MIFMSEQSKDLSAVMAVADSVRQSGGRALLVGGCVRDKILGHSPKDFDIECFGLSAPELQRLLGSKFELDLVGASFGVIKLKGHNIDVALPRRETKLGLGHRAFEMAYDPSLTLKEAAARRDFTINAIYCDPLTGETLDPWGGIRDLEKRIMRHVSDHFKEDPLRVLRGMQFSARFELTAASETIALCRTIEPEGLARERQLGEWTKLLLQGKVISKGLTFLRDTKWTRHYPELEKLIGCKQDPHWHPEGDVWNHTLCCLDSFASERIGNEREDLIVGLAVLCHDFGKPSSTFFDRKKNRIRSLGHDEAGKEPTLSFLSRLTNEESLIKAVIPLVRLHMRPFAMWRGNASDSAIRRLAAEAQRIDRLLRVASADDAGRPPFPLERESILWLAKRAEKLAVADSAPKPLVMGRDLMAIGMSPGPKFGILLKKAYNAQLDGKFSTREDGISFIKKLIKA
jgi:tRNA nucleotidyltransferase (CCA-adding enzyme)